MLITLFRTAILYFFVIIALRIMGKRQIGDMQPGELVITILISELAAIPIQDTSQPVINGIVAIFVLVVLEVLVSFISMKFTLVHRVVNGNSAVIIEDGVMNQKLMKQMRVTVSDLLEVLRGQGVFDISKVAYAILETNGSLSILLKPSEQPATVGDITGRNSKPDVFNAIVINDGKIINRGLELVEASRDRIFSTLKKRGLKTGSVFLMTMNKDGEYYIIEREEQK